MPGEPGERRAAAERGLLVRLLTRERVAARGLLAVRGAGALLAVRVAGRCGGCALARTARVRVAVDRLTVGLLGLVRRLHGLTHGGTLPGTTAHACAGSHVCAPCDAAE
ncbi:hypothetical protein SCALM49S_00451 [Streptomyces californicus]